MLASSDENQIVIDSEGSLNEQDVVTLEMKYTLFSCRYGLSHRSLQKRGRHPQGGIPKFSVK